MSILVITVDLECCRCRAKITKVLDCLKAEFCIEKVEFEDNNNKVVVRGKFDAEKLCKKVWCKAGNKVVKEIVIAEVWPMPAPPKPCKPCEKEPETKPEDSNTKLDKCDCGHCNPCKSKPEKCVCDHCKPESKPDDKKKEEQPSKPKTPPPKTEYKLMPCPYLVPYHTMCPSWPWQCPPHQQCQGCQQKPPQPPPPPPPPSPPRPCTCSNHGSCGCGGARLVWPLQPPVWPPPPWAGYNVVAEENSCTVM